MPIFVVATGVEKVAVHFRRPDQRLLERVTLSELRCHLEAGEFPEGSMGPKVRAAIEFLERGGKEVIITSESYLEAAADLGARQGRATWDVILPLALPGIVAGSIFTFSLTLGDYVTPLLVGGAGSSFIGNVVYSNVGIAHNIPFAAALAIVPVAVMALYLLGARRLGAFEAM